MGSHISIIVRRGDRQQLLWKLLTESSYSVSSPELGGDVISALRMSAPELVILDCSLPECDAVELVTQIRGDMDIERMPIIVLGNEADSERQVAALKAGANLALSEPCNQAELLTNVDVQLRLWRLQTELQRQLDLNQSLVTKLKTDLALGQQVQRSFLPPLQLRTLNFNLESRFVPSSDLSGDYFDYRLITPERLAIFLADVSGHGVASALLAGRLKAFFDENARRAHRPRLLLEKLNRVLIDLGEHYHIATAVFLHIDVEETALTVASAGHRNLFWLDIETEQHDIIPASGPALGMFDEFEIEESTHNFLPGRNRIVAYTDGLVEFRRQDGSWVTEEHFRDQILLPAAHMPLDEMTQSLMEGSLRLNNMGPWEDDVSLLVVDF